MEKYNIPTEEEIHEAIEKNKHNIKWQQKIYQVEQLVGDLYNYALLCAMETSKLNGKNRSLAVAAGQIKTVAETSRAMLNNYKHSPDSKIKFAYMANDDVFSGDELNEIDEKLVGNANEIAADHNIEENADLKTGYATIMCFLTGVIETVALKGILDAYKIEASALMICLEEIRKTVLELRKIFAGDEDGNRIIWHSGVRVETEKMLTNSKKSQYLSFNIGENEIIEEFNNIIEIFNYKDYSEAIADVASGKEPHLQYEMESFITIDAYLDLHQEFDINRPKDLDGMKIIIIRVPISYKFGSYKNIAVSVDFVNYPLLTGSGDEQTSANQQIKTEYIRACWHTIQAKIQSKNPDDVEKETGELIFLDWQKLLADHEASTKQPEFEDLLNLSDIEIQSILKKCELSDLLFALKGCSPTLKHKIEDNLSEKVKLQLREESAETEAVPLAKVEFAQDKIVRLAFSKE